MKDNKSNDQKLFSQCKPGTLFKLRHSDTFFVKEYEPFPVNVPRLMPRILLRLSIRQALVLNVIKTGGLVRFVVLSENADICCFDLSESQLETGEFADVEVLCFPG